MLRPVTARNSDASFVMSTNRGCFDDDHDQMDFVCGCCNSGRPNLLLGQRGRESAADRAPTRSVKVWDLDLQRHARRASALPARAGRGDRRVPVFRTAPLERDPPRGTDRVDPALRSEGRRRDRARLRQSAARRAAHSHGSGAQRLTVRQLKGADAFWASACRPYSKSLRSGAGARRRNFFSSRSN